MLSLFIHTLSRGGGVTMYACVVCGKGYNSKRSDSKYCSFACAQKAYRLRRRAAREAERNTLNMFEYDVFKAIQNSKNFTDLIVPAVYDVLALVDRDKWYDVLARLYLIAGATGCEHIDKWVKDAQLGSIKEATCDGMPF